MRTGLSSLTIMGLVVLGLLAHTTYAVEVTPKSPVPALSATVIHVTYTVADNSFIMVIGVVDGRMYLPEVTDSGPGKLMFSGPPGQYAVVGQEAGKRIQQTILVEGESPGPGPDPGPDPQPPPPGPRSIVIVYESGDYIQGFGLATQAMDIYAEQHGHIYRLLDDDSVSPTGQPIPWLVAYIKEATELGISEPFMVIAARDGSEFKKVIVPFPIGKGKAIEVLKKYGG